MNKSNTCLSKTNTYYKCTARNLVTNVWLKPTIVLKIVDK